jgi:hypothetical protein
VSFSVVTSEYSAKKAPGNVSHPRGYSGAVIVSYWAVELILGMNCLIRPVLYPLGSLFNSVLLANVEMRSSTAYSAKKGSTKVLMLPTVAPLPHEAENPTLKSADSNLSASQLVFAPCHS